MSTAAWRPVARTLLSPWCRLDVDGLEHVPTDGPLLVAANHSSHADSIALGLAMRTREITFLGDEGLQRTPLVGRHLHRFGMVPVQRGTGDAGAVDQLVELLADGRAVVVYPEGSRTRTGEVHRPRSGVARIAAATGVPVLPVGLAGTAALWPVGRPPRLRGGRVRVRFGEPLSAPSGTRAERRTFGLVLHDRLSELSGAPRADHFAPVGPPSSARSTTTSTPTGARR